MFVWNIRHLIFHFITLQFQRKTFKTGERLENFINFNFPGQVT